MGDEWMYKITERHGAWLAKDIEMKAYNAFCKFDIAEESIEAARIFRPTGSPEKNSNLDFSHWHPVFVRFWVVIFNIES